MFKLFCACTIIPKLRIVSYRVPYYPMRHQQKSIPASTRLFDILMFDSVPFILFRFCASLVSYLHVTNSPTFFKLTLQIPFQQNPFFFPTLRRFSIFQYLLHATVHTHLYLSHERSLCGVLYFMHSLVTYQKLP